MPSRHVQLQLAAHTHAESRRASWAGRRTGTVAADNRKRGQQAQLASLLCMQALLEVEEPLGPAAPSAAALDARFNEARGECWDGFTSACSVALTLCLERQLLQLTADEPQLVAQLQRTLLDTLASLAQNVHLLSPPQLHKLVRLANLLCAAFGNDQLGSFVAVGAEQSVLDRLQAVQLTCHCLGWLMRDLETQGTSQHYAEQCESLW